VRRHFTATGFLVHENKTLLLWHPRLQAWMPPGGHLEPDEDPVSAVLREVAEETGLAADVVPLAPAFPFAYPGQIQPPYLILLEDSFEPGDRHKHIDFVYFCRLAGGVDAAPRPGSTARWVDEGALRPNETLAEDVRALAIKSIEAVNQAVALRQAQGRATP
jgi:ADP-ribose pyrophosphatase YjhB (NUDIX family)